MSYRFAKTFIVFAVSTAGICYLAGCGSSGSGSNSGLAIKTALSDYQSIRDAQLPDLTRNQELALKEIMDEAIFVGSAALSGSPTVSNSMGSIRGIVANELRTMFRGASLANLNVSLDESRSCSKGGQLRGSGTGSAQINKSSATAAIVAANESGSLDFSACKTEKDIILNGSLQSLAQQGGSLSREAAITQFDADPDVYSVDYKIATQGTLTAVVVGESHTLTFNDFGVAFNYSDASDRAYASLPWDPLSGRVYSSQMDFFSNLFFCRGTLKIDDKIVPCGSVLKFGVDHQIKKG